MSDNSMIELALFAAASLGVVLSARVVLRVMRSRAAIARKSRRR